MTKVRLSFPYPDFPINRQTPSGSLKWGNYHFSMQESEKCDYWFVFNYLTKPIETGLCDPKNIYLITAEPPSVEHYPKGYLNQFNKVISCHSTISKNKLIYEQQALPWFVEKSYDELTATKLIEKPKSLSLITSNKRITDEHKMRLDFCLRIKEEFPEAIDLFGRGLNSFESKWDTLAPYKYTIAIENSSFQNYFTEKISDAYLTHTFPIYFGCPNLEKYFPEKSFSRIDIGNFDDSRRVIENVINSNDDFYKNRLPFLLQSKELVLNHYNLFNLIVKTIENEGSGSTIAVLNKRVQLRNINFFRQSRSRRLIGRVKNLIKNV